MPLTRAVIPDPKRSVDTRASDHEFARIAAAVATAANPGSAVAAVPPVPAGNTAGALIALARGGA